ncbi:MAG: carboxypeptidase regulatory-like domain-containing protein, partial [Gemmatimonadaceae bacterium]
MFIFAAACGIPAQAVFPRSELLDTSANVQYAAIVIHPEPVGMRLRYRARVVWGAALALASLAWLPHRALSQDSSGAQRGTVIDGTVRGASGRPLAGVTVEILGVTSLQTDSVGAFRVSGLGSGTYIFRVRKVGFTPSMKAVTVRGGTELSLPITLDPVAQQLTTVVTNADSARLALADPSGFAWRRRMGQGTYITQEE